MPRSRPTEDAANRSGRPFYVYCSLSSVHNEILPTPDSAPDSKDLYADNVACMDKTAGRVVAGLEKLGLRDNTLVVFVGDNETSKKTAETLTVGGRAIHGTKDAMMEGGSLVPLIANLPGTTPAGKTPDDLVDFSDFFPTFAALAGAELPANVTIDGHSFASQLLGKEGETRALVFVQLAGNCKPRWKFSTLPAQFPMTATAPDATRKKAKTNSLAIDSAHFDPEAEYCMKKILMLLLGLCAAPSLHAAESSRSKPNVLFIIVDDLRPDLGCYGNEFIKSPNIDALAKSGMVFDRAYCQQAVCAPSRSSVMTGMRPDTTKVWDLKTHFRAALPDVVTLPQNFKNHGYFVQGMGKIYHRGLDDPPSWSVPWQIPKATKYFLPESLAAQEENGKKAPANAAGQTGENAEKSAGLNNTLGPAYKCADVPDSTYQDGVVADLAIKTLEELSKKDQPFFLAVGFVKPHLPFVAPKKYWDLYDREKIALAPNPFAAKGSPDYAVNPLHGEIRKYEGIPKTGDMPPDLARTLRHGYYAAISYSDAQIGRVIDELKKLGLDENTIVVLWGDHGWKLGEHGSWGKHTNTENDVNAPLIVSAPGMKNAGTHSPALVEFVDIYPTLSELAGIPLPPSLEGTSLKPLLDNPALPWKSAVFSQYPRKPKDKGALMGYTMRTDRYRFTVWVDRKDHSKIDAIELFDHEKDPQENVNVAKDPDNAQLVESLLQQWRGGWEAAKPQADVRPAAAG